MLNGLIQILICLYPQQQIMRFLESTQTPRLSQFWASSHGLTINLRFLTVGLEYSR